MYIKNKYTSYNLEKDEYIAVHPFEECLMAIQKRYKDAENEIEKLEKENKTLKDRLESMQRAIYRGFPISEEEQEKIRKWQKEHDREVHGATDIEGCLTKAGAIGGDYAYEFIPTSVGTFGSVKCTCGAKFEFQEV